MGLKIYGHSDDLVEIDGDVRDEVDCYDKGVNLVVGRAEAIEGKNAEGLRVGMRYGKGGCWEARISPIDEDVPCPWPVSVTVERYTAVVTIDCPPGTPIAWKKVARKS